MDLLAVLADTPRRSVKVVAYLDADWIVWTRLLVPTYEVVELRVFPAPPREDTGLRSLPDELAMQEGTPEVRIDAVPPGGLPFGRLRDIHLRQLQAWAREHVEAWGDWIEEHGTRSDLERWRRLADEHPEAVQQETTEERLARLSAEYVALVEQGEVHPNKRLAERWGRSAGWVATEIHRARRDYGLLTRRDNRVGRADRGSSLTPHGRAVLEAAANRMQERNDHA